MDADRYWTAVTGHRRGLADYLDALSPAQWDVPSLCRGWRVRDVAGHLSLVPTVTLGEMVAVAPRAGFNPHRINTVLARRYGDEDPDRIVGRLREHAAARTTARGLDTRNAFFDILVHSQDIALPLGRDLPVPVEPTRRGLERVWEMGWPFRARRRMAGVTLRATDIAWRVGDGPEVTGPALALLLLLTGRRDAASAHLVGPGLASLDATA